MENPHDKIASFYNRLFAFPKHYDEKLVESLDQILKARHVNYILDCGCSTGNPSIGLVSKGYDVLAIDTSKTMLWVAKQNAKDVGIRLKTRILSMNKIDKVKKTFDCAIFHDCLYHISSVDGLTLFFRQIKKILSNNGLIYIATKKWKKTSGREARKRFEFRGIIKVKNENYQLIIFDIVENNSLTVFLLTELCADIISDQRIVFPWYPHDPSVIIEALQTAGFKNAVRINKDEEKTYNCVGILAETA